MSDVAVSDGHVAPVCADCIAAAGRGCPRHCGASNKQAEEYGPWCELAPGWGTDHVGVGHCRKHLGNTESHRTLGRRQLAQKALAVHLRDLTYEPLGDPVVELADVASKWKRLAEWATAHAAEVDDAGPWLAIALDLGKEARRALADCGRLGLEQRRVQLEEDKLELMDRVMRRAWAELGEDQDDPRIQRAIDVAWREIEDHTQTPGQA